MTVEEIVTKNNRDFQYFSESELAGLYNESFVCSYKRDQVLFYPGDPKSHLILLVSGVIKIERNDRSGNFFYLHFMKKQALSPRIGLSQDEVHYDFAIAYTDIEVVFVPIKLLERSLQNDPQQLIHWIQEQSTLLKENVIKVQKGTTSDAYGRIVTSLVMLLNDLRERIDNRERVVIACPTTIDDIARVSGTTQKTASSVMKKLVQMNRISYSHKFLTSLDTPFSIGQLGS